MTMPAAPAPDAGPTPAAPASASTPAPQPAPTPAPQAPPAPAPAAPAPAPPVPQPPADIRDISHLPQWAQKEIADLRGESAKYRTSARTESVLRHAYAAAAANGAHPDALLGSSAFSAVASALDPNAADFQAKLGEAIKAAVTANPWMAAQAAAPPPPTPGRSGGAFNGAPGEGTPITEEQLNRMTPEQIAKAYEEGKLKHLM